MSSGCESGRQGPCPHSPQQLESEGAIYVSANTECWQWGPGPECSVCHGQWREDYTMAMPNEYPATTVERYGQLTLF